MKYLKEGYTDSKYLDAKKIRDKRAKELRKEGYKVEVKTWDFQDLSRLMYYTLEATKKGLDWENLSWLDKKGE